MTHTHELLDNETAQRVRHDNCFDFLRYFFAFSLVIVHFCTLTGTEQFWFVTGGTRVKAFFIITGFLVIYSYIRTGNIRKYAEKRIRRIMPAYVTTILLSFLIGLLFTSMPVADYLTSSQTYKYLIANLCFLNYMQPDLPGLFTDNVYHAVNGSLWTMKVEVLFYVTVPFFMYFLRRYNKLAVLLIVICSSMAYTDIFNWLYDHTDNPIYHTLSHQLGGQLVYFYSGTLLLFYFRTLCRYIKIVFPISAVLYLLCPVFEWLYYLQPMAFACIIIGMAYHCKFLNFLQKYDNISYGIYLYHFPVIQLAVQYRLHEINIYLAFAVTFCATLILAALSWKYIEKPLMRKGK
ncbi:MAG: acyltransferase [Bacteroidales bacterium]|nr:acyltransferase [Bacteroidales bacterium]MCM1148011.1 acyltransferase [Bacteroidales bacterium]MCM1206829.1 acyltransferase [Bacillota bacterium]MCM1511033.1 acyltransferase [Clostridium sp.]